MSRAKLLSLQLLVAVVSVGAWYVLTTFPIDGVTLLPNGWRIAPAGRRGTTTGHGADWRWGTSPGRRPTRARWSPPPRTGRPGTRCGGASTPPNQPPTAASKIKQVVVIFPGEPRAG